MATAARTAARTAPATLPPARRVLRWARKTAVRGLTAPVRAFTGRTAALPLTLPLGLASAALLAVAAFTVYSGYLYPLRPDAFPAIGHLFTADPRFGNAWGGPTLAGAWAVHSAVALAIQAGALLLIRALTALQDAVGGRPASDRTATDRAVADPTPNRPAGGPN